MRTVAAAALVAATTTLVLAASSTDIEIKPGSATMTAEEKAIVPDVAKGAEHGVILVEETERNDDKGTTSEISYHMRAKILSPEGRGLADIAIPFEKNGSDLTTWWGRTILPDGRVLELSQAELKSQSVEKSSAGEFQEIRGALPGVVPGCVIDFGYTVKHQGWTTSTHVVIQKEWPVRSFRYRWVPSHYQSAAYATSRSEGLAIEARYDSKSVLVVAHDLVPVPEEPHMPPIGEARASVTFYYTTSDKAAEYWDLTAKRFDSALKGFLGNSAAIKDALESMALPPGATLQEKLRAAYDWLQLNVKNTVLLSAEEAEADDPSRQDDAYNAKTVLKAREGSPRQLDYLFAGMARALGAEADIVFAVDRTERFWSKALKSMSQFGYSFVAVRAPGEPDDKLVIVDAGSGLPYGEVPWRATGAAALRCTSKGSASVLIPPASPALNRADTHVTISFSDDNESMLGKWARTAGGATGLEYRRWMRNLDPLKRKDTLDELCGASGRVEVAAAELPGLDDAAGPFQIACDIEISDTNAGGAIAQYSLSMSGPWWPETPDFPAATRVHPVVFDYPKVDILAMDVASPQGFKPKDPPGPVRFESQYGRYQLVIAKTPTGFHVDRAMALTVLIAKPNEYPAMKKFFDDVKKADQITLSFGRDGAPR